MPFQNENVNQKIDFKSLVCRMDQSTLACKSNMSTIWCIFVLPDLVGGTFCIAFPLRLC